MNVVANNVNCPRWYIVGNQFVSHRGQRQVGVVVVDEWCWESLWRGDVAIIRHFHPLPLHTYSGNDFFF